MNYTNIIVGLFVIMLSMNVMAMNPVDIKYEEKQEIDNEFNIYMYSNINEDLEIHFEIDESCELLDFEKILNKKDKAKLMLVCHKKKEIKNLIWFNLDGKTIYKEYINIKIYKPETIIEPPIIEPPIIEPPIITPEEPIEQVMNKNHGHSIISIYNRLYGKENAKKIMDQIIKLNKEKTKFKIQIWNFKDKTKFYYLDMNNQILSEMVLGE